MATIKIKGTASIHNWIRVGSRLFGNVQDHPNQDQFVGTTQVTSQIVKMDELAGWCETENTRYTLGKPYEERGYETSNNPV